MALKIRLRRMGRRNAPTYRVVVAESSMPRDGRIVENIGHYNPRTEPITLEINRSRALYWLESGATPTETTHALFRKAGIYRPEEESRVAAAATAVADGAKKAAKKVKEAATKAAARAEDVVEDAVEAVKERREKKKAEEAEAKAAEADTPAAEEEEKPAEAKADAESGEDEAEAAEEK